MRTDEMNTPSRVNLGNLLLEYFCSVCGTASGRDASDKDFCAIFLEGLCYTTPMGYLEGCDSEPNGDMVETEKAMAEDDGILRRTICCG